VAAAARELRLAIGQDFHMVGWAADEVYADGFAPIFEDAPVPPAVVWSTAKMAEVALARLAERRSHPGTPTIRMTIPARLKLSEEKVN
jgi:hypothetical protein